MIAPSQEPFVQDVSGVDGPMVPGAPHRESQVSLGEHAQSAVHIALPCMLQGQGTVVSVHALLHSARRRHAYQRS
jgi:hypothetical protein